MKKVLLSLLALAIVGCHSGPDPVDDYPEFNDLVPKAEKEPEQIYSFDTQYGIAVDNLNFSYPPAKSIGFDRKIDFQFTLGGRWAESNDFILVVANNPMPKGLNIEELSHHSWKVSGTLSKKLVDNSIDGVFELLLELNAVNIKDSSFEAAVDSFIINPIVLTFEGQE